MTATTKRALIGQQVTVAPSRRTGDGYEARLVAVRSGRYVVAPEWAPDTREPVPAHLIRFEDQS
jgi:hypothetical protein